MARVAGESVPEHLAADGADLAAAEEAGEGPRAQRRGDDACVVVGFTEHVCAAAVAGPPAVTIRAGFFRGEVVGIPRFRGGLA